MSYTTLIRVRRGCNLAPRNGLRCLIYHSKHKAMVVRRQLFFPVSDNYFSLSATTSSFAEQRFFSTLVLTGAEDKALQDAT
jgi:hypothetical protein